MALWLLLALMVASFVLSDIFRPKPKVEDAKPAGVGDFQFPTATQGRVIPLVWGTVVIAGPNIVWWGDITQVPVIERVKSGGMFMKKTKSVVTGYRYFVGMQIGLCRGPIDNVRKVWVKEKLIFNGSATSSITINQPNLFGGDLGHGGLIGTLRIRLGTLVQSAVTYLTNQGLTIGGTAPTYPGTAYLVWEAGEIGQTTSLDPWKFEVRRIPNGLGLGTPSVNSGEDANPMNVVYEIMTDISWGLGIPPADIDTTDFTTAATTLETEGNGYSRQLDRQIEAKELLREVEEQIDGIVYLDHQTGKWRVKLVRDDYDIDTVPQLNGSNVLETTDFSRGAWDETTNQVKAQFDNRARTYQEDFSLAQDMANAMMQGGGTVQSGVAISSTINYPGVKSKTLANALAWRDLRGLSYPLAKATFTVDRTFWDLTPGAVVAWTDTDLGLTKLPMRILRIDHGNLDDNRMQLKCVQDVFQFGEGIYDDPPDGNWTPPDDDLDAIPADEQLAIEAPRAVVFRDPDLVGDMLDKIWCAARQQDNAVAFKIMERHATSPTTPTGDFTEVGQCFGFLPIGELKNDLESGTAVPTTSILLTATPDTQAVIEAAFEDNPDINDQGINFMNLILVNNEFMLPRAASDSGADVSLDNVYRGVLDGGQAAHSAGDKVFMVYVSANVIDTTIPDNENVHIKLLPFSQFDEVAIGDANQIAFTMDDRLIRPYPPASMDLNGTIFNQGTVSLDFLASGAAETTGIDLDFIRRDFRTADGGDEIEALGTDAETLNPTFPAVNNTDHDAEVWNDPDGSPALLFTEANISGLTQAILRIKVLRYTDGVVPSRMRIELIARHDAGGKTGLLSRNNLVFDFDTDSAALSGLFNFGADLKDAVSNVYTADAAGQHDFTLSSAFAVGDVEYRLNGGGWTQLIAAAATTGNIAGVSVSDTIELRHRSTDSSALKQIDMDAPGAGTDGYGIFYT